MSNQRLKIVWDLDPTEEREPLLNWLEACGWCWGISIPWHADATRVGTVRERGWRTVKELHAHPGTRERESRLKKRSLQTPETAIPEALAEAGGDLVWQLLLEDDSAGVGFPQVLMRASPRTHGEARELLDQYLSEAMEASQGFDVTQRWGVCGFASSAHAYARHGVDCVIVERANDDVDDLQTGIAFARGASKQYGCQWGIDLSLWWGVLYGCVQNLPASFHKRHFWISFLSGAQALRVEGGDLFWNQEAGAPSFLGEAFDSWAGRARSLDPGKVEVPAAVVLPEDHGWITPPYWRTGREAWNYARIPYRPGEKGIDGFFGAAFPGSVFAMDPFPAGRYESNEPSASPFALSRVPPAFAPEAKDVFEADPPVPFGRFRDRDEARERFSKEMLDPALYRAMGDSRWGDVLDVLTDTATLEVLSLYRTIVLLGPVALTDRLKTDLIRYVQFGGVLALPAGVVSPGDQAWTGVSFQPELRVGRSWRWGDEAPRAEAFRYCPAGDMSDLETEVLAYTGAGDPVVVSRRLGKGRVCTCLVPWFEGGHTDLAGPALFLFDSLLRDAVPVEVKGRPTEWLTAVSEGRRIVLVCNHDSAVWRGEVTVSGDSPCTAALEIGPYDLCVLEFSGKEWKTLDTGGG